MKAIRKSDGKIIDVEVHGRSGDCAISYHTDFKNFYKPEELDFNVVETKDVGIIEKPFDWQSFRAEAAKDILCVVFEEAISKGDLSAIRQFSELIHECILISDELIKQLKEKE